MLRAATRLFPMTHHARQTAAQAKAASAHMQAHARSSAWRVRESVARQASPGQRPSMPSAMVVSAVLGAARSGAHRSACASEYGNQRPSPGTSELTSYG